MKVSHAKDLSALEEKTMKEKRAMDDVLIARNALVADMRRSIEVIELCHSFHRFIHQS